jgi:hypothetical protein
LPQFLAGDCFGLHGGKGPWPGSGAGAAGAGGKGGAAAGGPVVVAVKDGTASFAERTPSGTTYGGPDRTVSGTTDQQKSLTSNSHPSSSRSKAQSGFNTDIAQVSLTTATCWELAPFAVSPVGGVCLFALLWLCAARASYGLVRRPPYLGCSHWTPACRLGPLTRCVLLCPSRVFVCMC